MRGRPKQAIKIISREIEKMGFRESYQMIHGMIIMAHLLNKITDLERIELVRLLNEKEDELVY